MRAPLTIVATALIVAVVVSLPTPAAAQAPSMDAKKAPDGVLDTPSFFGFAVVEARQGLDGKGFKTSTTLLSASLDEVYDRLRSYFRKNKEFTPGWKVAGIGRSEQHGTVNATLENTGGERFRCEIRSREERVIQVELTARAYSGNATRMTAPPQPDRTPAPKGAVKR